MWHMFVGEERLRDEQKVCLRERLGLRWPRGASVIQDKGMYKCHWRYLPLICVHGGEVLLNKIYFFFHGPGFPWLCFQSKTSWQNGPEYYSTEKVYNWSLPWTFSLLASITQAHVRVSSLWPFSSVLDSSAARAPQGGSCGCLYPVSWRRRVHFGGTSKVLYMQVKRKTRTLLHYYNFFFIHLFCTNNQFKGLDPSYCAAVCVKCSYTATLHS